MAPCSVVTAPAYGPATSTTWLRQGGVIVSSPVCVVCQLCVNQTPLESATLVKFSLIVGSFVQFCTRQMLHSFLDLSITKHCSTEGGSLNLVLAPAMWWQCSKRPERPSPLASAMEFHSRTGPDELAPPLTGELLHRRLATGNWTSTGTGQCPWCVLANIIGS